MNQSDLVASLDDLRSLYGELKDGEESSRRFREFILKDKWNLDHFKFWVKESMQKKFNREFQDIVIALGKRLGFDPEFGHYTGAQERIGYDGIWKNAQGLVLILETKLGSWIRYDVNQLGGYIDSVAKERGIADDKIYGLYAVGDPSDLGSLADQVRGSKYSGKIRIISSEDLLKLANFCKDFGLKNEQVAPLLVPIDAVNVGELIDIIETMIQEEAIRKETPPLIPSPTRPMIAGGLPLVPRNSLQKFPDGEVLICISRPDGIDFLKTSNGWGFIRVRRQPKYFALYVSSPHSAVKYFAEVEKIIDPKSPESPVEKPEIYEGYAEGKKLILFRKDSLRELTDPIPRGEKWPQSLFYTMLYTFITASSLDNIIG